MALLVGQSYWFKALGEPVQGYDENEREWTFDVTVDDEARATLTELGLADKIKNKDDDRGDFISFKRKGFKKDGDPAKPIPVVDRKKEPWPQDELIGNGSKIAVQFLADEWTYGKKSGIRAVPLKVMVLEHVPYGEDELDQFVEDPLDDFDDDLPFNE